MIWDIRENDYFYIIDLSFTEKDIKMIMRFL